MSDIGNFITLQRRVFSDDKNINEFYGDCALLTIWIRLIARANWCDGKTKLGGQRVIVRRGQTVTSDRELQDFAGIARNTVRRCLRYLEKNSMISIERNHHGTIITIHNYDTYQTPKKDIGPPWDNQMYDFDEKAVKLTCNNSPKQDHPETAVTTNNHKDNQVTKNDIGPRQVQRQVQRQDHDRYNDRYTSKQLIINNKQLTKEEYNTSENKFSGDSQINDLSLDHINDSKPKVKKIKPQPDHEDMELATDWLAFALAECPWQKSWTIEKFASAIQTLRQKTDLNSVGCRQVFEYIRKDDFWCKNAISPSSLLKKSNGNDLRKIDNILVRMRSKADRMGEALKKYGTQDGPSEQFLKENPFF
jgi:hypothetical protein